MKFYCDNCQTKYSIADKKVKGRVLKVRCKKCSHVITVREPRQRQSSAKPTRGTPTVEWHYSINGQSFGPVPEEEIRAKIKSGELKAAVYLWKAGFGDWLPLSEVATFADDLAKAEAKKPPPKTLGVSQELEAVKLTDREQAPDEEQAKKAPSASTQSASERQEEQQGKKKGGSSSVAQRLRNQLKKSKSREEPEPEKSEGASEAAGLAAKSDTAVESEDVDEQEQQQLAPEETARPREEGKRQGSRERLDQLRSRLQLNRRSTEEETKEEEQQEEQEVAVEAVDRADEIRAEEPREPEQKEEEVPTVSAEPLDEADAPVNLERDGVDDLSSSASKGSHDGLFSGLDDQNPPLSQGAQAPVEPEPESLEENGEDEDAVPFFPASAPTLGGAEDESESSTSISRVDEMTGSLLIQINEIKSDGRKRAIVGTLGAVVALLVVGGVGYLGWTQTGSDEEPVAQERGPRADHVGGQPEFRTYDREELDRFRDQFMVDEEVVISREDSRAAYERDQAGEGEEPQVVAQEDGGAGDEDRGMPSFDTDSIGDSDMEALEGDRASGDDGLGGSRFSQPELAGAGDMEGLSGLEDMDEGDRDRFERMAALQSDSQRQVHDADGEFDGSRSGRRTELSPVDISRGIGYVMESVGVCRERHLARGGGELEETELEVHLVVESDGSVGEFSLHRRDEAPGPTVLDDTLFERCMNSHTGRWRFPPFDGDPQPVGAPFSLR